MPRNVIKCHGMSWCVLLNMWNYGEGCNLTSTGREAGLSHISQACISQPGWTVDTPLMVAPSLCLMGRPSRGTVNSFIIAVN